MMPTINRLLLKREIFTSEKFHFHKLNQTSPTVFQIVKLHVQFSTKPSRKKSYGMIGLFH